MSDMSDAIDACDMRPPARGVGLAAGRVDSNSQGEHMKRIIATALIGLATIGALTACAGPASTTSSASASHSASPKPTPKPVDLTGAWTEQTTATASAGATSSSTSMKQTATITATTITVTWAEGNGTSALYWAGSYAAPTQPGDTYQWISQNDTSQTGSALLASSDPTKTFTYANGVISYPVTALGVTVTEKLVRQ